MAFSLLGDILKPYAAFHADISSSRVLGVLHLRVRLGEGGGLLTPLDRTHYYSSRVEKRSYWFVLDCFTRVKGYSILFMPVDKIHYYIQKSGSKGQLPG